MLYNIIMSVIEIFIFFNFAAIIVFNVVRVYYYFKCRKIKKPCYNGNCKFCSYCDKYTYIPSKSEIEKLKAYINKKITKN